MTRVRGKSHYVNHQSVYEVHIVLSFTKTHELKIARNKGAYKEEY